MTPTRETFERNLISLQDDILLLGSMVEEAILRSIDALKQRDLAASEQVYHDDLVINEKRYAIENNCLTLIATQQPMARDLRLLAAILEINTELERMGDYAKGISRVNGLLGSEPIEMPVSDLDEMAQLGLDMLRRALSAFVARDAETARRIPTEDDRIDDLYNHIYNELMQRIIQNPAKLERLNYLAWAAHNLERMADRVTNICERIVFVTTGEMRELDRTDDEWFRKKTSS